MVLGGMSRPCWPAAACRQISRLPSQHACAAPAPLPCPQSFAALALHKDAPRGVSRLMKPLKAFGYTVRRQQWRGAVARGRVGGAAGSAKRQHGSCCPAVTPPRPHRPQVETLEVLLAPMAKAGSDPLGSMGNDAPLAPMRWGGWGEGWGKQHASRLQAVQREPRCSAGAGSL